VAVYTLRGDCGSIRAALRIVGGRVYSEDQSYQAYGAVGSGGTIRVTLVRHRAPRRLSYSSALVDGVRLGESARAVGRPREERPTTDTAKLWPIVPE
jgi:hypothetical protein